MFDITIQYVDATIMRLELTGYLQILLAMKDDALGLHFPIFDVDLVATKHNGNVFTHAHKITMPVGHILVGHSRCHIKHDDRTLS